MKLSFKILFFILISLGMVSCLKDKEYDNGTIQSVRNNGSNNQKVVEIQLTATSTDNFLFQSFDAIDHDTTINVIPIVLASSAVATEDINVTLVARPQLVTDYNAAHPTAALAVPSPSTYTILNPGNIVTIPKGSRVGYLKIKFKPSSFIGQDWALGYAIASIDKPGYLISGNFHEGIFGFGIKNQYDGIYQVISGKVTRYTAPGVPAGDALSGNLAGNPDVYLITSGATSVKIPPSGSTGALYWAAGNNSQVAGIDGLNVTVNPATNLTTITSQSNATLANWVGSTPGITYNRYDPVTRTFYLAFKWNPTANVREYEIVLKYKSPRP